MASGTHRTDVTATVHESTLDLMAVYREVSGVSERAGAIVIVAFIEDSLSQAILARFRAMTPKEEKDLVKGLQAPLNTLFAKILTGYALNLYSSAVRDDLIILKDIRNQFAHEIRAQDFSYSKIATLCKKLRFTAHEAFCSGKPEKTDAKEQFHDAANHIMTGLRVMGSPSFAMSRILKFLVL